MNLNRVLPDGFQYRRVGRRIVLALPEYLELLAGADLASLPEACQGRGTIRRLAPPDGPPLLVRQYQRGGVLRAVNKTRYLGPGRAIAEARVCREAAALGVPVARAVGAVLERRPPFWLCWLATEEIEEALDLGDYLRSLPAAPTREILGEKRTIVDALAAAIRAMHDAGLYHADLQAKNILVRRATTGVDVFFVDLDKSVIGQPLPEARRADNLRRLNRSILKMRLVPPPIDDDDRRRFIAAYRAAVCGAGDCGAANRGAANRGAANRGAANRGAADRGAADCGAALPIFGDDVEALLRSCRRHAARHSIAWRIFR